MKSIAFLMSTAATGRLTGELSRREKILQEIAGPDTLIDIFGLETDPAESRLGTIESQYEASLSTVEDLRCAAAAQEAGYDAVIIPCGGDPGVASLREVLDIPVVPPGSTAKHLCSLIAPRFSVLTTGKGKPVTTLIHERDGLLKHVSTHHVGLSVPEVRARPNEAYAAMAREGRSAVEEHGAGAITFGCMSMGFLMVDERLSREIGVPVVNPVKAAVKTAEALIEMGVTHSKIVYPLPPSLQKG